MISLFQPHTGKIGLTVAVLAIVPAASIQTAAAQGGYGTEEFGMSKKQLVQSIERVEGAIAKCMREQGFQYIPVDYSTVRRGMVSDKSMPGMGERGFVNAYGFGISTTYTGLPPQLATGYRPAKIGLGKKNVQIFKNLSAADQVAYTRALLGADSDATFAVGLETENFSRTGGCTRTAIQQVFKPEQLKATYYNPKDAAVNKHPKMRKALADFSAAMRKQGYNYSHPDEVETDVKNRLDALTAGGTIRVDQMTAAQKAALKQLQEYEMRVAAVHLALTLKIFEPVEDRILREMFAGNAQ